MRNLAGTAVNDTYIKQMWVNQLPSMPRTVLLASKKPLDVLATTSDDMIEGMGASSVNEAESHDSNAITDIAESMKELVYRIDRIESNANT